jgi:type IV secretion system protein VirB1
MDAPTLLALALRCAPLVDPATAQALVAVESGANPNAIGVVGGSLERQPRTPGEAVATVRVLQQGGWNFSLGLAQINVHNLQRLGLTPERALEPCPNLQAMQTLLVECFERGRQRHAGAQRALRAALSCYYSGNLVTGIAHGYVARVVSVAHPPPALAPAATSIPKELR